MIQPLKAPFPYFGGKARIAHVVWDRFGDVSNFCEPFFGSGAVLLARPHPPRVETVNDSDGLLCNFWRALQFDPEAAAFYADWPVSECDLHAWHRVLVDNREPITEQLIADPFFFDVELAGKWVWGISQWIGSGWCSTANVRKLPSLGDLGRGEHRDLHRKRPHLLSKKGIHASPARMYPIRQMRHLSDGGTGVHSPTRQLPHLGGGFSSGKGINAPRIENGGGIYAYFEALAARLRYVRVCCGDWTRVLGPSVTEKIGTTAIFLDPPYSHEERQGGLYAHDENIADAVRQWAIANGDNPLLRIALCGYAGEHGMPAGWTSYAWKTAGGYGSQSNGRGRANAARELIWFSPHCLQPAQTLFDLFETEPAS